VSQRPVETPELPDTAEYREAVEQTANMVNEARARQLAESHGLQVLNLTWEDTGRFKNSAVGPNISDMTIQVGLENPRTGLVETELMPVIRVPNFSDVTGDVDPAAFTLLVGNEKGQPLQRVSLREFLDNPTDYLHDPSSWPGSDRSLLAPRDDKVLVSAQACFLPVPQQGQAVFNPVLFNYQSMEGDPAVLTILATREGTSVTVIDNNRDAFDDGFMWGQRLFFNRDGERASLTGTRMSDFEASGGDATSNAREGAVADKASLNMVLLIQVPLKQKNPMRGGIGFAGAAPGADMAMEAAAPALDRESNVENAVIGSGVAEGPFTEIDGIEIERDPNFPVRVTVQFYKATDNGVVSEADMDAIAADIQRVYDRAEIVGSLVTGGETGRVTEYAGMKKQPYDWWIRFWNRYEENTGISRFEAIRKLREQLGEHYRERPVCELYLRDVLRP
jgi:hypothetical protein